MEIGEDDWARMLAEVEAKLDRPATAAALGVDADQLELIAAGLAPRPEVGERLQRLYAQRNRLGDGGATIPLAAVPRIKTLLVAFVLIDAVVVTAIVLIVFAR